MMEHPLNILDSNTDTLRYRVQVERTLTQDDVRVSVDVIALVSATGHDRHALDNRIREALDRFITADWTFSTVQRVGEAVGYERVTLRANTRLPIAEIWNLEERARSASREGLALSSPKVNYSLPATKVSAVMQELRMAALAEVESHLVEFKRRTGLPWRIGDIRFGVSDEYSFRAQSSKGAYRSPGDEPYDDLESGLRGAERIALIAEVVLKTAFLPDRENAQ